MNLTSVRYQDSCIYIGLNGSQNKRESEAFQQEVRNAYVVYKIKTLIHHVQETVLLAKREIFKNGQKIYLKVGMGDLLHPEECEFEIVYLKINFIDGKSLEMKVGRSFKFLEICYSSRIEFPTRTTQAMQPIKKGKIQDKIENKIQDLVVTEVIDSVTHKKPQKEKFEEKKSTPGGFTIIEEITPVAWIVETIESKIQTKVDAHAKKLDMDIRKLCLETIDLLLSNLPLPELAEEYRSSSVMVNSIHRYINTELLENQLDGDEMS